MKKRWRVGTISMGVALIIMGTLLLLSGMNTGKLIDLLLMWWPVIFILLGLEIFAFLFIHKNNESPVRYDMLSVFFVGLLGMVCLAVLIFSASGVMNEVRYVVHAQERTVEIPNISHPLSEEISRVVVQADSYGLRPIDVSITSLDEVHLLGSYREIYLDGEAYYEEFGKDAATIDKIGDTLFVRLKQPPEKHGLVRSSSGVSWTLVLPEHVEVSLKAGGNKIVMNEEKPAKWSLY